MPIKVVYINLIGTNMYCYTKQWVWYVRADFSLRERLTFKPFKNGVIPLNADDRVKQLIIHFLFIC